jgi:hypothetical protein
VKKIQFSVVAILVSILVFIPLRVESQEDEIGYHQHDGIYIRFHAGFGGGKMVEENFLGSDLILQGISSVFRFQIGGTISKNLILFGEVGGFTIVDPELEWQGISGTISKTYLAISDIGIGVSYYFMPTNIYLSSTLTISSDEIELEEANINAKSDLGIGMYLSLGKEWWVGRDWGLGVALFGYFSNTSDKAINKEYTIRNGVIGIVFSATYH